MHDLQIMQVMQVWVAGAIWQRLDRTKLAKTIEMAFDLGTKHTAYLAEDRCGPLTNLVSSSR